MDPWAYYYVLNFLASCVTVSFCVRTQIHGVLCAVNNVLTGIGGFNVRLRNARNKDKDEEGGGEVAPGAVTPTSSGPTNTGNVEGVSAAEDKPRRKAQRRRLKNRLMECYPLYLQVS